MNGWFQKIAHIDLTTHEWEIRPIAVEVLHKFIGGKGLAGYFLRPHIQLPWHHPNMPILLFTGPLVNTLAPSSGRLTIMSRSPLTNTIGDSSVGGSLGIEIKKAGLDGIIITGKSKNDCGIVINDHKIEIKNAAHLRGKTISETFSTLPSNMAKAAIGPAAENGILFANVIVDSHFAAGRNGLGLVFAEKGLKYIVVGGSQKTPVFNTQLLKNAREDIFRLASASPILFGQFGISKYGTGALYDLMDVRHMMPTLNFQKTSFQNAQKYNAHSYQKQFAPLKYGCKGCTIKCKQKTKTKIAIPEFETMSHFSALINNSDIAAVVSANHSCNEMGMDTISTAATIACYLEINELNLTSQELIQLVKDIALKKNEGHELGVGAKNYAIKQGCPEKAMTVKGQELPAYDPRGAYGMALAYATSTRGACHLRAYPISHEILRKPVATNRFSFEGKARMIKIAEDLNSIVDSLIVCKFLFFGATLEEYSKAFHAVTGLDFSGHDLLKVGERIYYQERLMNTMNGFDRKDDDLPERFFIHPKTKETLGPIDRNIFLASLDKYYKIRGLDKNGHPTIEKSKELGL